MDDVPIYGPWTKIDPLGVRVLFRVVSLDFLAQASWCDLQPAPD
jgi:hypothetical protein